MEEKYPELRDRIQSAFIDMILLIVLMFVFAGILDNFSNVPDWIRIALFAGLFLYEPICLTVGCTLGNYVKGIRVKSYADTNKRINILQAFIRYVLKILLGWLSFLTIGTDPKRRAIHDMAAGSVMLSVNKE